MKKKMGLTKKFPSHQQVTKNKPKSVENNRDNIELTDK